MKKYDVVIVGGSAAGVTAAITARKHYSDKTILLLNKEKIVPIPCGIPYVFGTVGSTDKNIIPVDNILKPLNVDYQISDVESIDSEGYFVVTTDKEKIAYSKLVLATGSLPFVPGIPGVDKKNVYAIRKEVPYLQEILNQLDKSKNLCIVGCGFIGVEIAEECKKKRPDININIIEMQKHCLQLVYDVEFTELVEKELHQQNINLLLDEKVESILGDTEVEKIKLSSGKEILADIVILGIGAIANTELAVKSGIALTQDKAIIVNRYMHTNKPDIFACGDCTEKVSFFDGEPSNMKLASIATMEARVVGANLFSMRRVNMGIIGIFSTVVGKNTFACAGLTEALAIEKGYSVVIGIAESINRHPGCMPGGENLKIKLVFEKATGIIIGGQIVGAKSGGELINTISACITKKMTADDIATFQTGTHPALTASPIAYQLVNAAENAIQNSNIKN